MSYPIYANVIVTENKNITITIILVIFSTPVNKCTCISTEWFYYKNKVKPALKTTCI